MKLRLRHRTSIGYALVACCCVGGAVLGLGGWGNVLRGAAALFKRRAAAQTVMTHCDQCEPVCFADLHVAGPTRNDMHASSSVKALTKIA